jgi:hypothetical protein
MAQMSLEPWNPDLTGTEWRITANYDTGEKRSLGDIAFDATFKDNIILTHKNKELLDRVADLAKELSEKNEESKRLEREYGARLRRWTSEHWKEMSSLIFRSQEAHLAAEREKDRVSDLNHALILQMQENCARENEIVRAFYEEKAKDDRAALEARLEAEEKKNKDLRDEPGRRNADIRKLCDSTAKFEALVYNHLKEDIDQLKAENESLKLQIANARNEDWIWEDFQKFYCMVEGSNRATQSSYVTYLKQEAKNYRGQLEKKNSECEGLRRELNVLKASMVELLVKHAALEGEVRTRRELQPRQKENTSASDSHSDMDTTGRGVDEMLQNVLNEAKDETDNTIYHGISTGTKRKRVTFGHPILVSAAINLLDAPVLTANKASLPTPPKPRRLIPSVSSTTCPHSNIFSHLLLTVPYTRQSAPSRLSWSWLSSSNLARHITHRRPHRLRRCI